MLEAHQIFQMIGISGCGKSTFIERQTKTKNSIVISSDAIRDEIYEKRGSSAYNPNDNREVFKIFKQRYSEALYGIENHIVQDIYLDATNLTPEYRQEYYKMLKDRKLEHVEFIAVHFHMATQEAIRRQYYSGRTLHVPPEDIYRQQEQLVPPVKGEDADQVWNIYGGPTWVGYPDRASIMARVQDHYDEAVHLGYEVLGTFLQGSQNYGMQTEGSDIDTKTLLVPSLDDIVLNKKPVSTTHIMSGTDEHNDLKDIRLFFENVKKQNINFVEILFTEYCVINPKYQALWDEIQEVRERLAYYNDFKTILALYGVTLEKRKALQHPYPSIAEEIEKHGYDCYAEDTEFLTQTGWKNYADISDEDAIGTYNRETSELEFQHFSDRFSGPYIGHLNEVETRNSNFMVTDNHKLLLHKHHNRNVRGRKFNPFRGSYELRSFSEWTDTVGSDYHLPLLRNTKKELDFWGGIDITDDVLTLVGFFVSEGTINFANTDHTSFGAMRISQSDCGRWATTEFFDTIRATLLPYREYSFDRPEPRSTEYTWVFKGEVPEAIYSWCGHGSLSKTLPIFIHELSQRQAGVLLHALMLGDGSRGKNRDTYYTKSPTLAGDVQLLAYYAEQHAVVLGPYTYGEETPGYHVSLKHKEYSPDFCAITSRDRVRNKNNAVVTYSGNVVCFTVPNSILVTRRKGKIALQGNSKQLHHICRLRQFLDDWDNPCLSYAEVLRPAENGWLMDMKINILTPERAVEIADEQIDVIKRWKDNYFEARGEATVDDEVYEIVYYVLSKIIKTRIESDCEIDKQREAFLLALDSIDTLLAQQHLKTVVPEFRQMERFNQNNPYHNLDLEKHTIKVVSEVSSVPNVQVAAFFHDFGKLTTKFEDEDGVSHYYGHSIASEKIAKHYLKKMHFSPKDTEEILWLIANHDRQLPDARAKQEKFVQDTGLKRAAALLSIMRADIKAQSELSAERLPRLEEVEALVV
jgi:predicted kinase